MCLLLTRSLVVLTGPLGYKGRSEYLGYRETTVMTVNQVKTEATENRESTGTQESTGNQETTVMLAHEDIGAILEMTGQMETTPGLTQHSIT